jgi:hypothetical protein
MSMFDCKRFKIKTVFFTTKLLTQLYVRVDMKETFAQHYFTKRGGLGP